MASKRKRNGLTLEKKLEIISEMKTGKSVRKFHSPQLEIFRRTGRRLKSMHVSASDCPSFVKKRHIVINFEKLCYLWFLQQRSHVIILLILHKLKVQSTIQYSTCTQ